MPKKTFKENVTVHDMFMSDNKPEQVEEKEQPQTTQGTVGTHATHETQQPHETQTPAAKFYRINLKLKPEFQKYLDDEAWKARMSITQYINNLIQADMDSKST
jgi:hypothetical protein